MSKLSWIITGLAIFFLCCSIGLIVPLMNTRNNLQNLQLQFAASQSEAKQLQTKYNSLQSDLATAQSNLVDFESVKSTLDVTKNALTEIQKVYPPRYFSSRNELEEWLGRTIPKIDKSQSIWNQHLQLQKLALADGYIWSVDFNYVLTMHPPVGSDLGYTSISCVVAGDSVYWVWADGHIQWVGWK